MPKLTEADSRLTEFYDDYLDSYNPQDSPPVPVISAAPPPSDRVGAWARSNANPNYPPGAVARSGSRSAPNSQYAPSSYGGGGGGSLRRKVTRRANPRSVSRIQSTYEEEEEGYVSGEYEDGPFELTLIRVKVSELSIQTMSILMSLQLHYQDDIRGMTLSPDLSFAEFLEKVTSKFQKQVNGLTLRFKDEDGGKVTLQDESDYELAIETARESSKGKAEGKLEIWCQDA